MCTTYFAKCEYSANAKFDNFSQLNPNFSAKLKVSETPPAPTYLVAPIVNKP